MRSSRHYESDTAFNDKTYMVNGWKGVAFYVLGWQTEATTTEEQVCILTDDNMETEDDCTTHEHEYYESEPEEVRTGMVLAVMVGDDYKHVVDPSDLTELAEDEFCNGCGQIGCGHGTNRE